MEGHKITLSYHKYQFQVRGKKKVSCDRASYAHVSDNKTQKGAKIKEGL